MTFAERIRQLVEGEDFKTEQPVTVSIGVAVFRKDDTGDSLLQRADGALYEAKRTGRNRSISVE